ncbi:MAG: thermonuclease family protein [Planctomycetes bacterium]|nr:thermonuclease family protein [Planctomycetota bacterium]
MDWMSVRRGIASSGGERKQIQSGGGRKKATLLAVLLLACAGAVPRAQQEPAGTAFRAQAKDLWGVDLLVLADGRRVRLQGLSLPTPRARPEGFTEALKAHLRASLLGREVWITPERAREAWDPADVVGVVRTSPQGPSVNEEVLAAGLAVYRVATPEPREDDALFAAARRAQRERRGWFALGAERAFQALPYLNGAVLALYDQDPARSYVGAIDELAEAGFRHVCLLFSAFLPDVHGSRIDRHHRRTVGDERLEETIRHAKQRGMSVMLLPIVLLDESRPEDWRGVVRPSEQDQFWREYERFLAHYLDVAERAGVEIVSVGSELGSLEPQTERWLRVIRNARGRFRGLLTYSVNWDHYHVPRFFAQLDFVGMTAYFSLTKEMDPSPAELVSAWRRLGEELEEKLRTVPVPVVFTEVGYASQDGINRDPWNYFMNRDRIDLREQAECLAAFVEVAKDLPFLRGAYFFDYFGEGGPHDPGYSPRGKPAMVEWRRWARIR